MCQGDEPTSVSTFLRAGVDARKRHLAAAGLPRALANHASVPTDCS